MDVEDVPGTLCRFYEGYARQGNDVILPSGIYTMQRLLQLGRQRGWPVGPEGGRVDIARTGTRMRGGVRRGAQHRQRVHRRAERAPATASLAAGADQRGHAAQPPGGDETARRRAPLRGVPAVGAGAAWRVRRRRLHVGGLAGGVGRCAARVHPGKHSARGTLSAFPVAPDRVPAAADARPSGDPGQPAALFAGAVAGGANCRPQAAAFLCRPAGVAVADAGGERGARLSAAAVYRPFRHPAGHLRARFRGHHGAVR
eukprot:ctg_110.g46